MRHVLIAAVLGLSACSSPEARPAEAAPAAASAVDPAAEAFVRSLYTVEQGGTSTEAEDEVDGGPMFSARTQALLDEDVAVTPQGYVGYEEIHLCDCSDDGGMVLDSVAMTSRGPDRMDATVSMTWTMAEPPETKRQTLNLIKENGHWVIDDIERELSDALPHRTLVAGLTAHIADTRAWVAKGEGA